MNSHHQPQDLFYDQTISRPSGPHRHQILQQQQQHQQHQQQQQQQQQQHQQQQQTLHRQSSRQFESYGQVPNGLYRSDDHSFRYDSAGFGGMNTGVSPTGFNYEHPSAQTWNPNAFSGHGGFPAFGATGRMKPAARGRTGLPTTWLDQQQISALPTNPTMNSFGGIGPSPLGGQPIRPENYMADPEDELIPTAIVIKNIPFAVKKEQLVELMTQMSLPIPYAFNYHFDNGVFRGLAFANFTSADETATVIEHLNHFELQGRKLRVEYKKMLPLQERERIEREKRERRGQLEEQHRPMASSSQLNNQPSMSSLSSHVPAPSPSPSTLWNGHGKRSSSLDTSPLTEGVTGLDFNEPFNLDSYTKILIFRDDCSRETLIFSANLTNQQRRCVHTIAHHLGLHHVSQGLGEHRQVHVLKNAINISPPIPQVSAIQTADAARRGLNRAATIDFNEARSAEPGTWNTLRGQQSSGFLGIPDSPGGLGAAQNLRAAKSFADLRSYTPSPVPSTASFPATLQSTMARFQDYGPGSGTSSTPTLTPAISSTTLGQHRDDSFLVNGLGSMTLNGNLATTGPNGSPRRPRGIFNWDLDGHQQQQQQQQQLHHQQQLPQQSAGGPIGSNRAFSLNYDDQSRDRGQAMPSRQPRGPATERGTGFSRGRQSGHQGRGSDELRTSSNVEIIVE